MMIHLHDASGTISDPGKHEAKTVNIPSAGLTVMSTWWLGHLTLSAIPLARGRLSRNTCGFILGFDMLMPIVRYATRIGEAGPSVAYQQRRDESIEDVRLSFRQWARFGVSEEPL